MISEILKKYSLVLGLEIHVQPKTKYKMFCKCSADIWQKEPNTHTCPVCLGLPGALPVPNFEAIEKTLILGSALDCKLNTNSKFDRKHYFYPDLPKGYQISQYKDPFCGKGVMLLDSGNVAHIQRIHLEEDSAKSFHIGSQTLIDFNKGGMPLIELVTEPTFNNIQDAIDFTKKLQQLLKHLQISEANMEKGQMRLEPNISLRTKEMEKSNQLPKYKVEVKNINSFKFMEKVIEYEIVRQSKVLDSKKMPLQESRGFNEKTFKTFSQRSKEEAHDYRYFPDPDIPIIKFEQTYLDQIKQSIIELPMQTRNRLILQYKLKPESARMLVDVYGNQMVQKFEAIVQKGFDSNKIANLLLNKKEFQDLSVQDFVDKFKNDNQTLIDKDLLEEIVKTILQNNKKAVEDYKKGKEASIQYLLGMVMKETNGKAQAFLVLEILNNNLK